MSLPRDDEDPLARALGYPYPRHETPVLFDPVAGVRVAEFVELGPARQAGVAGIGRPLPVMSAAVRVGGQTVALSDAVAVIAAGSNGSAEQLARKYRRRGIARPILIAPAVVHGAVSVYSAHVTAYGSIPATLHPAPGATAALHVLMMPVEELGHLNATESLGVNYVLAAPAGLQATVAGAELARPLAYVSLRGALALDGTPVLLEGSGGEGSGLAAAGQREMLERVRRHVEGADMDDAAAGGGGGLETFVLRLIADADARAAVTARLAQRGLRWRLDGVEIVEAGRSAASG